MAENRKKSQKVRRSSTGRIGRPSYLPTIEERISVEQMKFCGEPEEVIARSLGISLGTLQKHFRHELDNGHANRRREVVDMLFKSAAHGNVSAQKHLDQMGRAASDQVNTEKLAAPLGKKAARQAGAEKSASEGPFATPRAPKLVVDNR